MKHFRALWMVIVLAVWGLVANPVRADDNQPLTISIAEQDEETYRVTWKVPANIEARHLPTLSPGSACNLHGHRRTWADPLGNWAEEIWRCTNGLAARTVTIDYPAANPNLATIVRLKAADGSDADTILLQPHESSFALSRPGEASKRFGGFLVLGFAHIWAGIDHLLFVAGLIFIARTPRRVIATITGFTLAHSLTLALAALDFVQLPIRAIEGVIALSIVFLAVEIAKGPRDTFTWKRPVVVASSFGLLHGFGFAAVLKDVGLPQDNLLFSLLAFNVGIEIGQIFFAAVILGALRLLYRARSVERMEPKLSRLAGYGLGMLASFWMYQRLLV